MLADDGMLSVAGFNRTVIERERRKPLAADDGRSGVKMRSGVEVRGWITGEDITSDAVGIRTWCRTKCFADDGTESDRCSSFRLSMPMLNMSVTASLAGMLDCGRDVEAVEREK